MNLTGFFVGYCGGRLIYIGVHTHNVYDIIMGAVALAFWFTFITIYFFNPKND